MGHELGRRPMLGAMAGALLAVMLDAGSGWAATDTTLPGGPIPAEALKRWAADYGGDYAAKWADSSGKRGSGTGSFSVDAAAQRAKVALALDGKVLGRTPLTRRSVTIDLSRYGYDADTADFSSSASGPVAWTRAAGGLQLTFDSMPGLAAGSKVEVVGRFVKPGVAAFTYTITPAKGSAVRGALNLSRKGTAVAEPIVPSASAASPAAIQSGAYACGLITKAEATQAFGEASKAPEPNGGRLFYGPTIDTSNCRVESVSGNQLLQMTVYHGRTPEAAAQYFEVNRAIGTPVPGLESRAYSFTAGRTVWLLAGDDVVELNVIDMQSTDLPPALANFVQTLASKTS